MRKEKAFKKNKKTIELYLVLILIATLFMSVAFANITDIELKVTGELMAPVQEGIFISAVSKGNTSGLISDEVKYYKGTTLSTAIELSKNKTSLITYNISIYNNSSNTYYFKDISYVDEAYDNTNIIYELNGIEPYITTIGPRQVLTFSLTFKYAEGITPSTTQILNSLLKFEFSNEMLEFSILEQKYSAQNGATWEQFVNSQYNTYGFTIKEDKVYTQNDKLIGYTDEANEILAALVKTTDFVSDSIKYIIAPQIELDKETLNITIDNGKAEEVTLIATAKDLAGELTWEVEPQDSGITLSGEGNTRTVIATKSVKNAKIIVSYGEVEAICVVNVTDKSSYSVKRIYGNSIQNGTPTPNNPVEIQSVGDKTVNLISTPYYDGTSKTHNGVTFTVNSDGSIKAVGTATGGYAIFYLERNKVHSAGTYTLSGETGIGGSYTTEAGTTSYPVPGRTFTLSKDTTFNYIYIAIASGTEVNKTFYPQLQKGSSITDYEPYGKYKIPVKVTTVDGESTVTNIYLEEPLRKVGDSLENADYIDLEEKVLVRKIKKVELNSIETWSLYSNDNEGISFYTNLSDSKLGTKTSLCSHFDNINSSWTKNYIGSTGIYSDHGTVQNKYFRAPDSSITTVDGFNDWLADKQVELQYILGTTSTTTIELPKIFLNPDDIVSVETLVKPTDTTISGHTHTLVPNGEYEKYNSTQHIVLEDCSSCGATDIQTNLENHKFDSNGKCSLCDYQCDHSDGMDYYGQCNNCGLTVSGGSCSHTNGADYYGNCINCGAYIGSSGGDSYYDCAYHDQWDYSLEFFYSCNRILKAHVYSYTCPYCGIPKYREDHNGFVDADSDGHCDICEGT